MAVVGGGRPVLAEEGPAFAMGGDQAGKGSGVAAGDLAELPAGGGDVLVDGEDLRVEKNLALQPSQRRDAPGGGGR